MSLVYNGTEIEKGVYNGIELDKLIFNGVTVWEGASLDKFIINVTTLPKLIDEELNNVFNFTKDYGISFTVSTIDESTVTFDGETITVPSNSTDYVVVFNRDTSVTGNLEVNGGFTKLGLTKGSYDRSGSSSLTTFGGILNSIIQWGKDKTVDFEIGSNYIDGSNIRHSTIGSTINIPEGVESISLNNELVNMEFESTRGIIHLPSTLKSLPAFATEERTPTTISPYAAYPANTQMSGNCYIIDNILVGADNKQTTVTIPSSVKLLCSYLHHTSKSNIGGARQNNITQIIFPTNTIYIEIPESFAEDMTALTTVNLPQNITTINNRAFYGCTQITSINIPANVTKIGDLAFANTQGSMGITSMRFNHSAIATIELPVAGSSTGMLRAKTARNMDIYTDNQTIHDYDYAADNITPTFYHLDGTAW